MMKSYFVLLVLVISLCFAGCSEEPETPETFEITDLAVSGESVYAATDEDGLYYLQDEKESWQHIEEFYFSPLLAVSETTAYAEQGAHIYRLDKGNSEPWVNISSDHGWGNERRWSLLIVGDTVYAGMGDGKVYRATGSERPSWVAVANTAISSLAISGTTLYAGSGEFPYFNDKGNGVFRSTDDGASWVPVNTGLTKQNVTSLAISGTTLYAGTRDGVFRLEHDDSWTHVGLSGVAVATLIAEPSTTRLYAGTWGDGVFRAPDGVSWRYWGLAGLPVRALAVSKKYVYAGTFGSPSAEGRAGIFRRKINRHGLWTPINRGLIKNRY